MAGEWLKFEKSTFDKPEVLAIAATVEQDPDYVIGKLLRMWAWFDTHTTNGNARGVTCALLDSILRVTGFAENVAKVGWLIVSEDGLTLPNFERHCGETAKQRALTAKRVADFKGKHKTGNESSVTSALPREEKKREEKKKKQDQKPCAAGAARFPEFWAAYPRHEARKQALEVWQRKRLDERTDALIADVERRKREHRPWREGYVPHAVVYLRNERWDDAIDGSMQADCANVPGYMAGAL